MSDETPITEPPTGPAAEPAGAPATTETAATPWWKKRWAIAAAVFAALVIIAGIAGGGSDTEEAADTTEAPAATEAPVETEAPSATEAPAATEVPVVTEPPAPETTQAPTTTEAPAPTTTTPVVPPEPVVLAGSGTQVVTLDDDSRESFLAGWVDLTHNGSSNFIVTLLDASGERVDGLMNEIGPYEGSKPWNLSEEYVIKFVEVDADGDWTIEFFPLEFAMASDKYIGDSGFTSGLELTGEGDTVLFGIAPGAVVMDFVCADCDSNIFVNAFAPRRDNLVNEIGDGTGFQTSVVIPEGTLMLEVAVHDKNARGSWTITLQ